MSDSPKDKLGCGHIHLDRRPEETPSVLRTRGSVQGTGPRRGTALHQRRGNLML